MYPSGDHDVYLAPLTAEEKLEKVIRAIDIITLLLSDQSEQAKELLAPIWPLEPKSHQFSLPDNGTSIN